MATPSGAADMDRRLEGKYIVVVEDERANLDACSER